MVTTQEQALEEQPSARSDVAATRQVGRRNMVIVAVTTLVLGTTGGYLLRWGTAPTSTITRTVTRTVERTVTAPAYTTSATARADVRFDGTRASYSGPTELTAGALLTVHFTSPSTGGSVVISRLDPAPTLQSLTRDIATANTSSAVMPMTYVHNVAARDGTGDVVAGLSRAGTYSVWAGPVSGPPGGPTVALAAVLTVTPQG